MKQRLNYFEYSPKMVQKLVDLGAELANGPLTPSLIHLSQTRASQMNGCTFCVDMHVKEAKIHGEGELRLHHLSVWRESHLFTSKERAVLEWTELVTKLGDKGISDEEYENARKELSEKEITDLTFSVGIINVWNRLNAGFRTKHGIFDKMYGLDKAGL